MSIHRKKMVCKIALLIFVVYAFITFVILKPDRTYLFFANSNTELEFLKKSFESSLSSNETLSLGDQNTNFREFCIFPIEVDPQEASKRIFGSSLNIVNAFGGLLGWNENNWHLALRRDNDIFIISMESSLFPFYGETTCATQLVMTFNRVNRAVVLTSKGER